MFFDISMNTFQFNVHIPYHPLLMSKNRVDSRTTIIWLCKLDDEILMSRFFFSKSIFDQYSYVLQTTKTFFLLFLIELWKLWMCVKVILSDSSEIQNYSDPLRITDIFRRRYRKYIKKHWNFNKVLVIVSTSILSFYNS